MKWKQRIRRISTLVIFAYGGKMDCVSAGATPEVVPISIEFTKRVALVLYVSGEIKQSNQLMSVWKHERHTVITNRDEAAR